VELPRKNHFISLKREKETEEQISRTPTYGIIITLCIRVRPIDNNIHTKGTKGDKQITTPRLVCMYIRTYMYAG